MAAVDSPTSLAVNLALHRLLLLFDEFGKNVVVFEAHEDIREL
jgi:hypothetical protein